MKETQIKNKEGSATKRILDLSNNVIPDTLISNYKTFNVKKEVTLKGFEYPGYILEDDSILLAVRATGIWETEKEFLENVEQMGQDENYINSRLKAFDTVKQIAKA